ncbi:MAG: exodeoxyribonuclease VII large subunit [Oscillospiraceae bacterium]|nr:exodeoxyribonuclease VII large subunit [Oscillospiraceae bacterium]
MSEQVLSVLQINEYIRNSMDRDMFLNNVAVRGEISNYKMYPSGHHYFTLKDEESSLRCVMFRGNAIRLRFRPENGMKVIVMGKISVYPRDGAYQLYANAMVVDGVGDLHAAFEQLKAKLAAQGMFDAAHKKPLPKFPETIGIITSSAGAAIHDMLRILQKRYPLVDVKLLPVRVQGAEAPEEIASAIYYANAWNLADLLIVGRGGGSIEDLWAFNDEIVAKAIYDSNIPVISAVGHEPDVTISDFVADLRAATPSNAAELAVPDREALQQSLDGAYNSLLTVVNRQLTAARRHLDLLASSATLQNPLQYVQLRRQETDLLRGRMIAAQERLLAGKSQKFISLTSKLDALSPLKVLTRGYSMARDAAGHVIRSTKQVNRGDSIRLTVTDGDIYASVDQLKENRHGTENAKL